jgi:uncharacterized protein
MINRDIVLPEPGTETFFLWGPRQTGKTTLLRQRYPDQLWVDLLKSEVFRKYLERPERLRQELAVRKDSPFVIIDEIQKLPLLLNEVHWLHENLGVRFALCGSSARKVRKGQANLLGGRALRFQLFGLTALEVGHEWDLQRMLNNGYLPRIYLAQNARQRLRSYVADYLRGEVAAEGLVRNLPVFSEFLNMAALSDTELVNFSTIARDCGVSSQTIKGYFGILTDTLLGSWLPAFTKRPKRRVIRSPKFYFSDVGVVNFLARRGHIKPGSELYGKAFENWVHHELRAYGEYSESWPELSYWRLASGLEVDFIWNDMEVAIEAKASSKITRDHLKGLRHLKDEHPGIRLRAVICLEADHRITADNIHIVPARKFPCFLRENLR